MHSRQLACFGSCRECAFVVETPRETPPRAQACICSGGPQGLLCEKTDDTGCLRWRRAASEQADSGAWRVDDATKLPLQAASFPKLVTLGSGTVVDLKRRFLAILQCCPQTKFSS